MKYCCILVFLSFVFLFSCSGQVKREIAASGQPRLIKTQGTSEYANVHCGLQDKAGNLWFGTTGEGVYRYEGSSFTNFTAKDGLSHNEVWCVYEDRAGNLWFGTGDGICRYNADSKTFSAIRFGGSNLLPSGSQDNSQSFKNAVWSILEDKAGNFWVGTSDGVYRSDANPNRQEKTFTRFLDRKDIVNKSSLHLRHIQSIVEDRNGNIWFASWNQEGACRFDGKTLTSFKPNNDGMVHAILEDKSGNIWFGTRNHGACRYDGQTFATVPGAEKFGTICIYSMAEDKAGNIWFGSEPGGAWCYHPSASAGSNAFTNFTTKDGLSHNAVFSVTADRSGKLWFGTRETGLCSYDGKSFADFSE